MRFKLGRSLACEVKAPTTFIFNAEVARPCSLDVIDGTLTLAPDLERRVSVSPNLGNCYLGVNVGPAS
ncbi:MAG: hypothetical protein PGN25_17435 [Methylorubrum populi]